MNKTLDEEQPGEPQSTDVQNTQMGEDLKKLDDDLSTLKEDFALHKPIAELVRYLLYFWAAISLVLGIFGWRSFSDLEQTIDDKVKLQLPRDKAQYAEYERLIDETEDLYSNFEKLTSEYKVRVEQLEYAELIKKDFDIEGQLLALEEEVRYRMRAQKAFDLSSESPFEGSLLDPAWRAKAIAVISEFRKAIEDEVYPADFIFNIAQTCRILNQFQLVSELTEAAESRNPSPPVRAMALSSRITITAGDTRDQAFDELMSMVRDLGPDNPQIVLAEAWNAAENERRYTELMDAIESLISSKQGIVPSYVLIIKARALMRNGGVNATEEAEETLSRAWAMAIAEPPLAQWYESTLREAPELLQLLREHRELPQSLDELIARQDDTEPDPALMRQLLQDLLGGEG